MDLSSNIPELTEPTTVVIYVIIWGIIGTVLGCTVALIIEGIIGSLKFCNWLFIFLGGSFLTILTPLMGSLAGWLSVSLIPILFLWRQYLSEKSPKCIEEVLDKLIGTILYSVILTFVAYCFERNGIHLRGLPL